MTKPGVIPLVVAAAFVLAAPARAVAPAAPDPVLAKEAEVEGKFQEGLRRAEYSVGLARALVLQTRWNIQAAANQARKAGAAGSGETHAGEEELNAASAAAQRLSRSFRSPRADLYLLYRCFRGRVEDVQASPQDPARTVGQYENLRLAAHAAYERIHRHNPLVTELVAKSKLRKRQPDYETRIQGEAEEKLRAALASEEAAPIRLGGRGFADCEPAMNAAPAAGPTAESKAGGD